MIPGSKRSLDPQEDTPVPKRRRIARKKTRPTGASGTEALQSSSGTLGPSSDDSELTALRRTLQQVQKDLSVLQRDQRQLDDITRGIRHGLDEAQPHDTLQFFEEHFTCAGVQTTDLYQPSTTQGPVRHHYLIPPELTDDLSR